jgi:hypothetical protein
VPISSGLNCGSGIAETSTETVVTLGGDDGSPALPLLFLVTVDLDDPDVSSNVLLMLAAFGHIFMLWSVEEGDGVCLVTSVEDVGLVR